MSKSNLTDKITIAKKVLDFWYIVDFLDQEAFPTTSKENEKNIDQEKNDLKENRQVNTLTIFHDYPSNTKLSEIINEDNHIFNRYSCISSNLHLCIGKVKKEFLIQELYRILDLEDDRPEKETSKVCLFSLKVDKNGVYQENSLRISPLVWGIYQCNLTNGQLGSNLSNDNYQKDISFFEQTISKTEPLKTEDITTLYKQIFKTYIKPMRTQSFDYNIKGSFIYTRYKNEKIFEREDSVNPDYSELIKGFYTNDLKLVRDALDTTKPNPMFEDIIDYVVNTYTSHNEKEKKNSSENRINIRESKTDIEKWLHPDLGPDGKWPSKFSPALMQQIAINIGISKSEETRSIFSVNGPPGTGKTTLLKEIIVSNIVERAKILSTYETADDAFEVRYFQDGIESHNSYDKYVNKYFAFKNKDLTKYSILVASSNNAAVENITKDLPDMEGMLSSLSSSDKDNLDTKKKTEKIRSLFDISLAENKEKYKKDKTQFIEKRDVYFSHLANNFFAELDQSDKNSVKDKYWGIISAPMGKSNNISKYSFNVLSNLIKSFYVNNQMIKDRQKGFNKVKTEFEAQLELVTNLKRKLKTISQLSEDQKRKEEQHKNEIESIEIEINNYGNKLRQYQVNLQSLKKKKEKNKQDLLLADNYVETLRVKLFKEEDKQQVLIEKLELIRSSIISFEDERKWYEVLFGNRINTERLKRIKETKEEKQLISSEKKDLQKLINNSKLQYKKATDLKKQLETQLVNVEKKIVATHNNLDKCADFINKARLKIINIEMTIEANKKKLQEKLANYSKDMTVMDKEFWNDFDSKDNEINTRIQTSNPWITDEYNREREILFYLALQVHKEFILSSKSCRDNFKNLQMMWKYKENYKGELCNYSKRDKEKSFSHLLNTLFLLTPVMSTTFASVGRFLGNIKEQGALGLLVVDEAGQASPHLALGALWRCQQAIIVGDPKQVEPVVTDDADAIKKAFSDKTLLPYMNKTVSVQEFADNINRFGSYIKDSMNTDAPPTWVGCPLIVHRRCINPMFDISNSLSYDQTMKIQTGKAKRIDEAKFALNHSAWIDIRGREVGQKNHFVPNQGKEALRIIIESFKAYNGLPDLYVISPFTTVINGVKNLVKQSQELQPYKNDINDWLENYCGTVHKFQGKEAKEVIFILGCDKNAMGAVRWVKPNIINVAATRAKYRLYIIGDYNVWRQSDIFQVTKRIMDDAQVVD